MSDAPQPSLDALMARLADGDRSAFTLAFKLLWTPTLRLCSKILKHEADAADAAQLALAKILERASDYDRTRPTLPWALSIAAWECRTILRQRSRRKEVAPESAPESAADTQEGALAQDRLVAEVLEAMAELSTADRETLIATFWEQAASVSGATLRKRRERALKRLRDSFRRLYGLD